MISLIKICAGLIVILALLMSLSMAADTSWRHSGFTLWGYDINLNGLTIHNGSCTNISLYSTNNYNHSDIPQLDISLDTGTNWHAYTDFGISRNITSSE